MKKLFKNSFSGFTLIEVLLVVAILGILAGIVIIAVNPSRQLAQSHNAQRKADVTTILNAVYQYAIDNNGRLPGAASTTILEICLTGTGTASATCGAIADLEVLTNNETYLVRIPVDPSGATTSATTTGYYIQKTANNRVTISAPGAELGETISATR